MTSKLDLDRGLSLRRHKETGIYIGMYKDEPGVYMDQLGNRVSEKIAADVGFPVNELRRKRDRKEKVGAFLADLDSEANDGTQQEVLAERGGYKLLGMPGDRALVVDAEDGSRIHQFPLPRDTAMQLLDRLVPDSKRKEKPNGSETA